MAFTRRRCLNGGIDHPEPSSGSVEERSVPNCRLALTLAYHMLSPALNVEETGLDRPPALFRAPYIKTSIFSLGG